MLWLLLLALTGVQAAWESDFQDPLLGGGSWLTKSGEPLNVVVSMQSSKQVLQRDGFEDWLLSLGYQDECLGLHMGGPQEAHLGDSSGYNNQTGLYRWAFRKPGLAGSCWESLVGGSHVRYWMPPQKGDAVFLAASNEHNISLHHKIVSNGYDEGRDDIVGNATIAGGTTSPFSGVIYAAQVSMAFGFLDPGLQTENIDINHEIPLDGQIAVLRVTITAESSIHFTKASILPLGAFLLASLLGGSISFWALRPSSSYMNFSRDADSRDIHVRRHQQLLLGLEQLRRMEGRPDYSATARELGLRSDTYQLEYGGARRGSSSSPSRERRGAGDGRSRYR